MERGDGRLERQVRQAMRRGRRLSVIVANTTTVSQQESELISLSTVQFEKPRSQEAKTTANNATAPPSSIAEKIRVVSLIFPPSA
eukprot:scaffold6159_cov82-Alexandrium_tamarense.AAC.1